jgi:hypothetical protein
VKAVFRTRIKVVAAAVAATVIGGGLLAVNLAAGAAEPIGEPPRVAAPAGAGAAGVTVLCSDS